MQVQAQAGEVAMRVQQGAGPAEVEQLEEGMVALLGDACRLHLCSGHTEKAVGIIQALLEFHFFSPALAGQLGPFTLRLPASVTSSTAHQHSMHL